MISSAKYVFISYRREDALPQAGRIYDLLAAQLGQEHIFMDVASMRPGLDFVEEIRSAVTRSDILLAIISEHWLSANDTLGRRLDHADDYVRLEIATALGRGVRVIPILVNGVRMPRAEDLPAEMRELTRRNAVDVADKSFRQDMDPILASILETARPRRTEWSAVLLENFSPIIWGSSRWAVLLRLSNQEHRITYFCPGFSSNFQIKVDDEVAWEGPIRRSKHTKIPLKDGEETRFFTAAYDRYGTGYWVLSVDDMEILRFIWGKRSQT